MSHTHYDAIVVGAGPAGFTAGIYLSRFLFKTLLIDTLVIDPLKCEKKTARSSTPGLYHNVPGFPEGGIERHDLKWLGIQQAKEQGCEYRIDKVIAALPGDNGTYQIRCENETYTTSAIFLALGLHDSWPDIPDIDKFVGKSLFWSVEANGKEAQGKPAAVIGNDDKAVEEVLRLKPYASQTYLLTDDKPLELSEKMKVLLSQFDITVIHEKIKSFEGTDILQQVFLAGNLRLDIEVLFYPQVHSNPHNLMALQLGAEVDEKGFIQTNEHFETKIPNLYAIGDITPSTHKQVITSYYQGMEAAWDFYNKRFNETIQQALVESAIAK